MGRSPERQKREKKGCSSLREGSSTMWVCGIYRSVSPKCSGGARVTTSDSSDGRGFHDETSAEIPKCLGLKQVMFTAGLLRIFNMLIYITNLQKENYTQFS